MTSKKAPWWVWFILACGLVGYIAGVIQSWN